MSRNRRADTAAVAVALLAIDDITTDTDESFALEWSALAVCVVWFVAVAWRIHLLVAKSRRRVDTKTEARAHDQ